MMQDVEEEGSIICSELPSCVGHACVGHVANRDAAESFAQRFKAYSLKV
jgi:hypothetical protein